MIVEVNEGKLQGVEKQSVYSGKSYYSFIGIPYAKPPVGDLRFKPPVPFGKWAGIRDATKAGEVCIQQKGKSLKGSEDCLYLNVHSPELPPNVKVLKPVMVYIHGGGFQTGSGSPDAFGFDYLVDYDVILVTVNYRLHIFGFLNMNVDDCPGNTGLKDQLLAVKWVKENIKQFGGDPENITLMGESAGSVAVHLHTLSPASKGYFQRAILISGSAACSWAFDSNPTRAGFRTAQKLGLETDDPEEVVAFLREQPAETLTTIIADVTADVKSEYPGRFMFLFAPSVELAGQDKLVTDTPEIMAQNIDHVPIITGLNSKEGIIKVAGVTEADLQQLEDDFSFIIKGNFECDENRLPEIAAKLKKTCFGDKAICMDTLDEYVDMFTTIVFYYYHSTVDYIVKANAPIPVYEYEFVFDGKFNSFKVGVPRAKNIKGASHSDGLGYLLYPKQTFPNPEFTEPETTVIKNMCTVYTNFAKTGNPNPIDENGSIEWTPSTEKSPCYLRISDTLEMVEGKIFGERFAAWQELLESK